jgi:hypothetical protein
MTTQANPFETLSGAPENKDSENNSSGDVRNTPSTAYSLAKDSIPTDFIGRDGNYSKEEMLALFKPDYALPEEFVFHPMVMTKEAMQPVAFTPDEVTNYLFCSILNYLFVAFVKFVSEVIGPAESIVATNNNLFSVIFFVLIRESGVPACLLSRLHFRVASLASNRRHFNVEVVEVEGSLPAEDVEVPLVVCTRQIN